MNKERRYLRNLRYGDVIRFGKGKLTYCFIVYEVNKLKNKIYGELIPLSRVKKKSSISIDELFTRGDLYISEWKKLK